MKRQLLIVFAVAVGAAACFDFQGAREEFLRTHADAGATGGGTTVSGGGSGGGDATGGGGTTVTGGGVGVTGGGTGFTCDAGLSLCGTDCVPLNTTENCGACGTVCATCLDDGGVCGCSPGAECRSSSGACDVAELCSDAGTCPNDDVLPATTQCGSLDLDAGCDRDDFCDGVGKACPDAVAPDSTLCRPVAGSCDVDDYCDGVSPRCPVDVHKPPAIVCRAAVDVTCDVAEQCTGGAECPPDVFQTDDSATCGTGQSCDNGSVTRRHCAGDAGACLAEVTACMNGYLCNGSGCRTSCSAQSDCNSTTGFFCNPSSQCEARRANGVACTGSTSGFQCQSGACSLLFVDGDNDNYGTGSASYRCGTDAITGYSSAGSDCCDTDARAHPGQTAAYASASACATGGGFDFNCDGVSVKGDQSSNGCTGAGSCSSGEFSCSGDGWATSAPACGASGSYKTCGEQSTCNQTTCPGCTTCSGTSTSTQTQSCR